MCGRYTIKTPPAVMAELFEVDVPPDLHLIPRQNASPTQDLPAVRRAGGGTGAGGSGRELVTLRWGLIPSWADDSAIGNRMINARAETVAEKPAYRSAFRHRRCLIPADGFYEWQAPADGGKRKQPWHFRQPGGAPFAFAGLWERWDRGETGTGEPIESFTILTTEANELVRPIHDRMPVIIAPEDLARWLDPAAVDPADLEPLLAPFPSERLEAVKVGPVLPKDPAESHDRTPDDATARRASRGRSSR